MTVDKEEKAKMRRRGTGAIADINVTPMVDVMLVMLIIFMVITPMLSKGIPVELVKTRNPIAMPAEEKTDAIVCAISRDGKTYLNNTQMPAADMPQKVKDLLANRQDRTVFIRADARARYEKVVDVVDNLRAAGVDQLGLITDQLQDAQHPANTLAGVPAAQ
jgi:biopolymer transport protein ExbD